MLLYTTVYGYKKLGSLFECSIYEVRYVYTVHAKLLNILSYSVNSYINYRVWTITWPRTSSIILLFLQRTRTSNHNMNILSIDWIYIPNVFSGINAFHLFRLQLIFSLNTKFIIQFAACTLYTRQWRRGINFNRRQKSMSIIKLS